MSQEVSQSCVSAEDDQWAPSPRPWIKVGCAGHCINAFTAITYNILNEVYVLSSTAYDSYLKGDTECLKYSAFRNTRILKELILWNPDIVGLQEMNRDLFITQWLPQMAARGYSSVMATPRKLGRNSVVLFFKTDTFELLSSSCDQFQDLMEKYFNASGDASRQLHLLEHPRAHEYCGVFAKLRHRPSDKIVVIAVFHLTWEDYLAPVFKSLQAAAIAKHAEHFASADTKEPYPVLLLGDLNSTPEQMTYQLLAEGKWSSDVLEGPEVSRQRDILERFVSDSCRLPSGLHFQSAYHEAVGREPKITSLTEENGVYESCNVDFIWRSKERGLTLTGVLGESDEREILLHDALPSPIFPSDHLPVMAEFQFEPNKEP